MSIGGIDDEAALKRWLETQLQTPGVLPQSPKPAVSLTKAGVPSDKDFPAPPGNGIFAIDTTGPTLYARINDAWTEI